MTDGRARAVDGIDRHLDSPSRRVHDRERRRGPCRGREEARHGDGGCRRVPGEVRVPRRIPSSARRRRRAARRPRRATVYSPAGRPPRSRSSGRPAVSATTMGSPRASADAPVGISRDGGGRVARTATAGARTSPASIAGPSGSTTETPGITSVGSGASIAPTRSTPPGQERARDARLQGGASRARPIAETRMTGLRLAEREARERDGPLRAAAATTSPPAGRHDRPARCRRP